MCLSELFHLPLHLQEARSSGWTVLGASSVPSNLAGSPPVTYCGNMKINSPTLLVLGEKGIFISLC